jgi:hypothetical protein
MTKPTSLNDRQTAKRNAETYAIAMATEGERCIAAFDRIKDGDPDEHGWRNHYRDRALIHFAGSQAWAAVAALLDRGAPLDDGGAA